MKKQYIILAHILIWLLIFGPFSFLSLIIFDELKSFYANHFPDINLHRPTIVKSSFKSLFTFTIIFYTFYFPIFNFLFRGKINWKRLSLALLTFTILFIVIKLSDRLPFAKMVKQQTQNFNTPLIDKKILTNTVQIVFILIVGSFGVAFRTFIQYLNERRRRKELETTNLKSEINMLRSQVNPHFIFNTLNNIDTLIKKDPNKASEMVIKLSQDMRYMLYDSNIEFIDLESEINFLKNYIALQEIRIRKNNFIKLKIDIENKKQKIAPMLFIPLVENAFKHYRIPQESDSISINIRQNESSLEFNISNFYDDVPNNSNVGGIGLSLVKKRFELIYPKKHMVDINDDNNIFKISITINLDEN